MLVVVVLREEKEIKKCLDSLTDEWGAEGGR